MSDIIVAIFFIATIVGLKKPIYGSLAGLVLAIGYCYFRHNIGLYSWVLLPIFGALFGFLFPLSARWLFSGLRGGRGKIVSGTTYIGGFGGGEVVSLLDNGLNVLFPQITKRRDGLKTSKRDMKKGSEY